MDQMATKAFSHRRTTQCRQQYFPDHERI